MSLKGEKMPSSLGEKWVRVPKKETQERGDKGPQELHKTIQRGGRIVYAKRGKNLY